MRSALGGSVDGVLGEYRIFPKHALVRTPEHLSDIEAAALPCAGVTAWSAVIKLGGIKPDQTVLTQGTGGVSCSPFSSPKCAARASSRRRRATRRSNASSTLGADFTLNYKATPDWGRKPASGDGHGVDLVCRGRRRRHAEQNRSGRPGSAARSPLSACSPGRRRPTPRLPLMVMQQQRLQGVTVGSVEDLQAMADAIAANRHEAGDRQDFSFDQAKQAFAHMEEVARISARWHDCDWLNSQKWQHLVTCNSCWFQQLLPPPLSFKFPLFRLVEKPGAASALARAERDLQPSWGRRLTEG